MKIPNGKRIFKQASKIVAYMVVGALIVFVVDRFSCLIAKGVSSLLSSPLIK